MNKDQHPARRLRHGDRPSADDLDWDGGAGVQAAAPSDLSIDTPEFQRLLDEAYGAATEKQILGGDHGTAETLCHAESKLVEYINGHVQSLLATKPAAAPEQEQK